MSWQQWKWVHYLKDRRHNISQTSLLGCVTVQQQPLIRKKIFFLPCRSIASTEGGRGDVGKVPEQVAAAGVIGERWQGQSVLLASCREPEFRNYCSQRQWRGDREPGRTDCHSRMAGTSWTNRKWDENGSGGLQPQTSLRESQQDDREAGGTPADVWVAQSSHARRQSTRSSHKARRRQRERDFSHNCFSSVIEALIFFYSRKHDLRGTSGCPQVL